MSKLEDINIQPLEEFEINEDFFNPWENEDKKPSKPKKITDAGLSLGIRKETYNPSRIEYFKKGPGYIVKARTHFGANETVEIAPVIILGSESTAVDGLKDIVFALDKRGTQYALVLGYGALYSHSDKPNLSYAYNRKTKQMHFITTRIVKFGEDLTINYGKDYWVAKKEFNMMGDHDKGDAAVTRLEPQLVKGDLEESEVQPNAADNMQDGKARSMGDPRNRNNPAITGVAIRGIGQQ